MTANHTTRAAATACGRSKSKSVGHILGTGVASIQMRYLHLICRRRCALELERGMQRPSYMGVVDPLAVSTSQEARFHGFAFC
jgi:hypothetical protein